MTSMTSTYTQAEAEVKARTALTTATDADWPTDTVSDAVDVHLGRVEREQGRPFDRSAIPRAIVLDVLATIVRDAHADA